MILNKDKKQIIVNPERFRTIQQAEVWAIRMAMRQSEIETILRTETSDNIKKIIRITDRDH